MPHKKVINKLLGELLIENGLITREQLEHALARQRETGELLGETIVKMGFAAEEDVAGMVAAQYGIPYLPVRQCDVDKKLLRLIPKQVALKYCCFPIDRLGSILTVAMENPLDKRAVAEIGELTHCKVLCYVSTTSEIKGAIEEQYDKLERGEKTEPEFLPFEDEGSIKVFQLDNGDPPEE